MDNKFDLIGRKFGLLTVVSKGDISLSHYKSVKYRYWKCQCECGNVTHVPSNRLLHIKIKSCGCKGKFDYLKARKRLESMIKKIDSGCWQWTGSRTKKGYGYIHFQGKTQRAHVVSWILFRDLIPNESMVLHTCDNPSCVNPDHLFVGNASDNTLDMLSKNRQYTKLTEGVVKEIRCRYKEGNLSHRDLAKEYNLSRSGIAAILNRIIWKHV